MSATGERTAQQQAVYDAERDADLGRSFGTIEEVQVHLDSLTSSNWWADRYPEVPRITCEQHSERGGFRGASSPRLRHIILSRLGFAERIVLHEVAHVIAGEKVGHTAPWARTHLELVYLARGSEAYTELQAAYKEHGVDV